MKQSAVVLASLAVSAAPLHAEQPGTVENTIVVTQGEAQSSRQGPAEHFTGSVRVDQQFQARGPGRASGARVTFEPGARAAWHSHPLGQTLIVTIGVGRVQRWGDPVDEIRPGDVVWIPPGQKPHGAEVPYAFATLGASQGPFPTPAPTPEDQAVARMVNACWANFAKTGGPSGPGLPHWPRFDPSKNKAKGQSPRPRG
jgi:quercetin dioxygenase-like cupin family protein